MQQTPTNTTPFLQRNGARPPTTARLWSARLGLVGAGLGGALLVFVFMTLQSRQQARETPKAPARPGLHEVSGRPPETGDLQLTTTYAGIDRTPPKPVAPPPAVEPPPPFHQAILPTPPLVQTTTMSPSAPPRPVKPAAQVAPLPPPPAKEKPKPARYLFVPTQQVGKSPFADAEKEKGEGAQGGAPGQSAGGLIHQATWEKPVDVTKTWYRSQRVHGLTTSEMVSDLQGPVVIRVTRPLQDKFLQGVTLIPQHSLIIASQTGNPQFGASRLAVTLDQVELPDGAVLSLKAKVSDAKGAQGLHGKVNNHWGRVLAGAGISALLSIGTRIPAGNQTGFAPSLAQEAAQDVSGSIARTGNQVVQRELNIPPTITVPAGTAIVIYPQENISLSHPPTPIK